MKLNFLNCKPVGQLFIGLVSSVISVTGHIPVRIIFLISHLFLGWRTMWKSSLLLLSFSGIFKKKFHLFSKFHQVINEPTWQIVRGSACVLLLCFHFTFARSPFVSFLYERGWRQNFNRSGFPGADEEVYIFYFDNFIHSHSN